MDRASVGKTQWEPASKPSSPTLTEAVTKERKVTSFSTPFFRGYEASCSACAVIAALTLGNKTLKWKYRRGIGFLLLHSFSTTLVAFSSPPLLSLPDVFFLSFFPFLSFSLCLNFLLFF